MVEFDILRRWKYVASTVGQLILPAPKGVFCYTLEDSEREVAGLPPSRWKIPHITAIGRGRFRVVITKSVRFNRDMPLLLGVQGFEGIRIHNGNTDRDTDGCTLLGYTFDPAVDQDFVGRSKDAFRDFMAWLVPIVGNGTEVYVNVKGEYALPEAPK